MYHIKTSSKTRPLNRLNIICGVLVRADNLKDISVKYIMSKPKLLHLDSLCRRVMSVITYYNKTYINAVNQFLENFELNNAPPIVETYVAHMNEIISELKTIEEEVSDISSIDQLNKCRHIRYVIDIHYAHIQLVVTNHAKILSGVNDNTPVHGKRVLIPLMSELLKYDDLFTEFSIKQLKSLL